MCGIAGILLGDGRPDPAALTRMLAAQRHRGPDGEGTFLDGSLALGAVRLAVLDRSEAAHQPMSTPDGRFTLAYNGEVYNYRELRGELEAAGEAFRSSGDTEVVLKALARWGQAAIPRFNGAFAFALWDKTERRLLLARDRIGLRPLYWAESGGGFVFASEIKAVLASGRVSAAVDGAALAELFRFQNIWSERTLFAGILPVPPGGVVELKEGRATSRRLWRFVFPGDARFSSMDEAAEALKPLLASAVRRQLASDVPLGSALSAGLDGAAVVSEAARALPGLHTFTVGFPASGGVPGERAVDERGLSRNLAAALGTRHHEEEVPPGQALEDLRFLIWALEEPRLAASFQNLAAARLARRHVTVVLSGGGGDELFGGYPWRYRQGLEAAWSRVLKPGGERGFWTDEGVRLAAQGDPEGVLRSLAAEAGECSPLHRMMAVEAGTFLPAYCVLEDKLHMAVGAEVRAPLLDHDLVDWAVRLPESLRLAPDGATGKVLLRRALAGRLPAEVLAAPKQGFVPPLLSWAGKEPWRGFLEEILLGPRALGRGLTRPEAIRRDLEDLALGKPGPLQRVWTTLAFELWCRVFLDGEKPA